MASDTDVRAAAELARLANSPDTTLRHSSGTRVCIDKRPDDPESWCVGCLADRVAHHVLAPPPARREAVASVDRLWALTESIATGLAENDVHLDADDRSLIFNALSQAGVEVSRG